MSSSLWVPSTVCPRCLTSHTYNSAKSSTYTQNGTSFLTYFGSTSIEGLYDNDSVTIGGVETHNATFAEVRSVTGSPPQFLQFGGIYGLGFPGAAYNNVTPPVFQMIAEVAIKEPVFSLFLGRNTSQTVGGVMSGGIDRTKYQGNISYIPIKSFIKSDGSEYTKYWQFTMDSGYVRGTNFCVGGCQVIIASMVGGILGPKADIIYIFNTIGVSANSLSVNCGSINNYPNVILTINGLNYVLRPSDYIIQYNGQCSIGFGINTQDDSDWLLGNIFLAKFYTIFDIGKMSIGLTGAGGGSEGCRLFGGLIILTIFVKMLL